MSFHIPCQMTRKTNNVANLRERTKMQWGLETSPGEPKAKSNCDDMR